MRPAIPKTILPKRIYPFIAILLLISNSVVAQNFKALKKFGTKAGFDRIQRVSAEANGGCSFLFAYVTAGTKADTLKLGSYQYVKNPTYASANFLVRLDSGGNVIKVRLISQGKDLSNMCRDDKGNFYIAGQISGTSLFDGVTLSGAKGNLVYAKYDTDLNRIWLTQTGGSANPFDLFYSQGHLLFTCRGTTGTTVIGTKSFTFTYTNFIFGEINQADGTVKWCNNIYKSTGSADYVQLTGLQYLKGNFYISGISSKDVNLDSGYLFKGGFISLCDSNGKYKRSIYLQNKKTAGFSCITSDGENLYASGNDLDSFFLEGKKIYSPNGELTVASFTPALKLRWYYQPKVLDKTKITGGPVIAASNNGYIYFGGILKTKIEMAGNAISPVGKNDVFFFKMDELGNVLWAANGGTNGEMFGLDAIGGKYVYGGGYFEKSITFGNYTDTAKGETDGWLTKIFDNSIFRGNIQKGPYCAGDTIKIPYTKFGEFDTTNYFIAELSDENGRFEKGVKELGRLMSNKEGTVIGKLPSFEIASSGKYSIRIRSTSPALQSYYRADTLNLLIYSRDKANPGPAETICMGDSLKLNTYGGSQWTWSPKYNMDNNTLRQPMVWPSRDTVYRIIIADSHGCGQPDTAFKKIHVRAYPKAKLNFTDTILCDNSSFKISAKFQGGDSAYQWQWLAAPPAYQWLSLGKGKSKYSDTITYRPSTKVNAVEKVAIILTDGCTSKPDTTFINISHRTKVEIKTTFRDTILCINQILNYKAKVTGGVSKYLRYQWKDLNSNTILSAKDSLSLTTTKATKIQLVVNDGCLALGDTAEFAIQQKPQLKANSNLRDTAFCFGKSMNYTSKASGGDSAAYGYQWILDGKQISISKNLVFKTEDNYSAPAKTLTSSLTLILKDNCSLPNDTIKKTITIKPRPNASFSYDAACSRTITNFQFTGTKPQSPIITSFHWNLNNEATSTLENPSHKFATVGNSSLILTLTSNNGCTDTLKKEITIKPQSKAEFTAADVCQNDSVDFKNLSVDATGYKWKFGDGNTSNAQNTKHKYQIPSTTTFNVTLVALVANGCSDSTTNAVTINENPNSDFDWKLTGSKLELTAKNGGSKYNWIFGTSDSATTSNTKYTHTIKSSDQNNVCLRVTNLAGCMAQTCKNIGLGGVYKFNSSDIKIYPQPANTSINVEIPGDLINAELTVTDNTGQVLIKTFINSKIQELATSELANGIYFISIEKGSKRFNGKLVINK